MSPYLSKPVRSFQEARNQLAVGKVDERIHKVRFHLKQAEKLAKEASDWVPMSDDAYDRLCELVDFLGRDLIPDWLVPAETAVKEWTDKEEP